MADDLHTPAEMYQQARPGYPEPLDDTLADLTGVALVIVMTCVEIGPGLASVPRRQLSRNSCRFYCPAPDPGT